MNEVVSISSTQCFSMGLKLPPMLKHTSMEDASGETWPLVSLTPPFSWRHNTTFVYISLVHVDMSDPSQFYMISFHISYIIYFMYIDHRWFSKHVPSVPSTFMNYVPDPAAPSSSSSSSRMCVKSWRRFAKSMRWTRPRRAPGSSFAPATSAPWWQRRLRSLIYMILYDFICNMNLCCTDFIWVYMIQ